MINEFLSNLHNVYFILSPKGAGLLLLEPCNKRKGLEQYEKFRSKISGTTKHLEIYNAGPVSHIALTPVTDASTHISLCSGPLKLSTKLVSANVFVLSWGWSYGVQGVTHVL